MVRNMEGSTLHKRKIQSMCGHDDEEYILHFDETLIDTLYFVNGGHLFSKFSESMSSRPLGN